MWRLWQPPCDVHWTEEIEVTSVSARELLSLVWRGRTIHRAWMELYIQHAHVNGLVLDLGSGGSNYFSMMQHGAGARLLTLDICREARPDLVADLEHPLPLATASVDSVILLNVLEHLYHYEHTLCEVARVLRPGGLLILFVPFLIAVHTACRGNTFTHDYFRYSGAALHRLLAETAGFGGPVRVKPCALGPFTAAAGLVMLELRFGWLKAVAAGCAFTFDHILNLRRRGRQSSSQSEWAIGYVCEAVK